MEVLFDAAAQVYRYASAGRTWVNSLCRDLEPWQVVLYTAVATIWVVVVKNFLCKEESLWRRVKKSIFKVVRRLPYVKDLIATEIHKTSLAVRDEIHRADKDLPFLQRLPDDGWTKDVIIKETRSYTSLGSGEWTRGRVSGAVYNYSEDLVELATRVFELTAWTNPLHPDVFPGVRRMEAEIVRMACSAFRGDERSCGVVTSGGTESILMACKAYRDRALDEGIERPEMVVPITAHAAFDKAASLMRMTIRHVPIDPKTFKVNLRAMRRAISKNTCMLVGSCPQFPHGIVDPITEIAKMGVRYNVPVHVDACLGGFLVPFMEKAGFPLEPFDFRVAGVTSISADTHKYGAAPKGSSVLMYRNEDLRHHQYFVQPDWPGGVYASPTIAGSRSGGIIATCWATMLAFGESGYVDMTRKVILTTQKIVKGLRKIPHIFVLGDPEVSVVALGSRDFNVYRLSEALGHKGWNLNILQFPSSIHLCVTMMHTAEGVAEQFLEDVRSLVGDIMKDPKADDGGKAAIYGMAQRIPDRSLVAEIACSFLDACYSTPCQET